MITITKRAAEEIRLSTQNPDTQGLQMRFAIDKTDEGFQYLMGFDERADGDIHLESNGIEYILTYAQKELLEGMVVDFDEIDTEGGYGFLFMNPNDPNYQPPEGDNAPKKT
ncbi:MAG: sulfur oxidoreductase [Candidatus Thiodubiliella endoseptemdiera]|uniref:Sulfur oxidoreductase n=1 Tax=Candidatus Thiodubiliella endoseptemdiera TaxID=2738886 RepID=A0A853F0T2_9GAMM|nr:sulfur oxidoreductase [Candidatus Thiodubiliella endoseptemdiera]